MRNDINALLRIIRVMDSLLEDIHQAEEEELKRCRELGEEPHHEAPGEVARSNPYVLHDVMERIDVGDCGWIIPVRVDGIIGVLTYHYGEGWSKYIGEDIPDWIREQIEEHT